jgi:tetratricopeptide (TPR) repeat protein
LQSGNTAAAEDCLLKLECLLLEPDTSLLVRLNRGLLAMSLSQYAPALVEFEAALSLDPSSVVAANNAAVCQLYCCRLADSIATLERQLRSGPRENCHPVLISNLANLYQMNAPTGQDASKATLERLVMAVKDDDFDIGALQIGQ